MIKYVSLNILVHGMMNLLHYNTLCDLKRYQDFLYRNFYKHKDYEVIFLGSNQPGCFFATAKTYSVHFFR